MRKLILIAGIVACSAVHAQSETEGRYLVGQFGSVTYVTPVSGGATRSYPTGSVSTGAFTPSTVITSHGTYQVVPNYTTGRTMAVIQTSRGGRK